MFSLKIPENLNPGAVVAVLETLDEDEGQSYSYRVDPRSLFAIEGDQLKSLMRFNYEVQHMYHVNISVTDSGNDTLSQYVVVNVLDVNDEPSGIILPQGTAVAENSQVS